MPRVVTPRSIGVVGAFTIVLTLMVMGPSAGPASAHFNSVYYPSGTTWNNAWISSDHKLVWVEDNKCNGSDHKAFVQFHLTTTTLIGAMDDFNGCNGDAEGPFDVTEMYGSAARISSFRVCETGWHPYPDNGCSGWKTA